MVWGDYISMILTDFDAIASDLPDVSVSSQNGIQKSTPKNQNHHEKSIFIFGLETFPGHLGGVGWLYLDDFDRF